MKKAWQNFLTSFKPTYSVVVNTCFVIPGMPFKKRANRLDFEKGEFDEAKNFYDKVVTKTKEIKMAPAEIHLVKGKKKVVMAQNFGPVDELKKFRVDAWH
ncbi:MAG: hypothetical protein KI790_01445 [Cyclobacteriaceae bacterium]|nr:hypothetical protein [Cyclobacteriaceae bacterium HetDA_MAG_MS6]